MSKKESQKAAASDPGMSNAYRKYLKSEKYQELQRQKKRKKAFIISAIAIAAIVVCSIAFYAVYNSIYGYIMTFDGKKISTEDFKFIYALLQGDSKDEALATLTETLVVNKEAAERGFSLTDDEKSSIEAELPEYKSYISSLGTKAPNISNDSFVVLMGASSLYSQIWDSIAEEYVVDEDAFQTALKDYRENNKQDYIDIKLKYVTSEDEETVIAARNELLNGTEVDEVIKQYSDNYSEDTEIAAVGLSSLQLDTENVNQIIELNVSDVTEVMDLDGYYAVFVVDEKNIPSDAEVETSYRESYIDEKSYEIITELIDGKVSSADAQVNQAAFNSIK